MLKNLLNPYVGVFAVIYGAATGVLVATGSPLEDVVASGVILGIVLPLVAWIACRGMPEPEPPLPWNAGEWRLMLVLLLWIAAFLAFKGPLLDQLTPSGADVRLKETFNTLLKIAAFVAVPAVLIGWRGWGWEQGGRPTAPVRSRAMPFLVVAIAAVAVQYLLGSQFHKLLDGTYAGRHLALGATFCFLWMSIEAGLVEEFFFRWYLQSRLAALTRSQVAAVLIGALIFGLAHAPGIVLRGAGAVEGLGDHPALGTTIAYVIATQGLAGIVFGVLWARTRSFILLVLLHGFFDALSNTAAFMDTWRL